MLHGTSLNISFGLALCKDTHLPLPLGLIMLPCHLPTTFKHPTTHLMVVTHNLLRKKRSPPFFRRANRG